MEIKVLGTGCTKCTKLLQLTNIAVNEMQVSATITKIEDITKILSYGIMSTPGLVINEKVVCSGRIPTTDEIKNFIKTYL